MVSSQTLSDFEDLKEDMTVLSLHLNVFRTLYAENLADVKLLNAIASGTFWVLQNALRDSIVLRVARLTDPPKYGHAREPDSEGLDGSSRKRR